MKKKVIVCPGDPAGIGPEITIKSILSQDYDANFIIISHPNHSTLYKASFPNNKIKIINGFDANLIFKSLECKILVIIPSDFKSKYNFISGENYFETINKIEYGRITIGSGLWSWLSLECAVQLIKMGIGDVLVTGPINKESLHLARIPYLGHTEILTYLTNSIKALTMFETGNMRIFFLTRHMSLREACDYVKEENIFNYIVSSNEALTKLGFSKPKIAISGLNPHCGDNGLFGNEENQEIIPAVSKARALGINISGPIGADSVFWQALHHEWDAVLALYHDQGHIAAKTSDFHGTVSITLGLPFLRTSVDHGTALDIAGKNIANATSMTCAIQSAIKWSKATNPYNEAKSN